MSFLQSLGAFEILLSLFGAILVYRIAQTKLRKLPLPPGPKPLPFLGNLRDMPTGHIHLGKYWAKHKELYGASIIFPYDHIQVNNDFQVPSALSVL